MKILVQKFGGTSVATEEARQKAAAKVIRAVQAGWHVVVVVSAIGRAGAPYATDTLIQTLRDVDPGVQPAARELDMMMACGEIISTVVLAHTLRAAGLETIALTGLQAGILTNYQFGNARILDIDPRYMVEMLGQGKVVLVAGFQGGTERGAITTLGRGGSDTTAAALGAALKPHAEQIEVEIYTDVNGVKTADPRHVPTARTLARATYDEVAEMAHQGAKVVHPRAAEIAGIHGVPLWVKNTFDDEQGTLITSDSGNGQARFTGVTHTGKLVYLRFPLPLESPEADRARVEVEVYRLLEREKIAVHLTSASDTDFAFAVERTHLPRLKELLDGLVLPVQLGVVRRQPPFGTIYLLGIGPKGKGFVAQSGLLEGARAYIALGHVQAEVIENCTMVSVIASGLEDIPGVVLRTLGTLNAQGVPVYQMADSRHSISALIPEADAQKATRALHEEFGLGGETA
ncbi:aspartate kinase [Armatimonas rosea]|uniref:Aspartokinase n=1 Tax=Armatimonas rosea TaxID=685828 RepID=A0A7W9SKK4_ARMRO|nr:aspartate kinase [Armatimonas rosea]MBB6048320.1 aspartate kinase [Armatimonas rosea]